MSDKPNQITLFLLVPVAFLISLCREWRLTKLRYDCRILGVLYLARLSTGGFRRAPSRYTSGLSYEVGLKMNTSNAAGYTSQECLSAEGSDIGEVATVDKKMPRYFDNQATTPLDPRVLETMLPYFMEKFGNPHSRSHSYGWNAESAMENARKQVAKIINAESKDIIFTSGATEANNMAIKGLAAFYKEKGNHVITLITEHKCVLESCRAITDDGFEVTYLPVQKNGLVDLDVLKEAITDKTILVTIMAVNNEIGVIQPIAEIGAICRERGVFFHTDATQAIGKIDIDVDAMKIDLMSMSSHKIYGPQGIGALYLRRKNPRVRLRPLFSGGGQERGLRSGTVPLALAVGFGRATEIAMSEMYEESERIRKFHNLFLKRIVEDVPHVYVNGDLERRVPHNINLSFLGIEGESFMMSISDLAVSSGSACTSSSLEPSYVLHAIDISEDMAHSSIRFGFGRFTTLEEVEFAIQAVLKSIDRLRDMSPLWEMIQEGIDLSTVNWNIIPEETH